MNYIAVFDVKILSHHKIILPRSCCLRPAQEMALPFRVFEGKLAIVTGASRSTYQFIVWRGRSDLTNTIFLIQASGPPAQSTLPAAVQT